MQVSAQTVDQLVAAQAIRRPDHPAIVFGDRRWTYAETHREMERRAAVLAGAGLQPGAVIATAAPVSDELALTFLACCRAGCPFLPLSPQWTAAEIAPLMARSQPALFLMSPEATPTHQPTVRTLPLTLPGQPDAAARRAIAARAPYDRATHAAIIQTTSGTTGSAPKLALIPHALLLHRTHVPTHTWWMHDGDVVYTPSATSFAVRDFCEILGRGGTKAFSHATHPDRIEAELAGHRVTVLTAVPAILRLLARHERPARSDLALRVIRFSAAALPVEVGHALTQRYRATLLDEYGSTEGGWMICTPRGGAPVGSCGKANPGVAVRIVDEGGHDLGDGAVGELIVRAPQMMQGYLGDPDATAETLRDGWLWTGDLAHRVGGCYFLHGRRTLRINVSGFKVAPEEIEAVLERHPAVREAAVLSVPDAARGAVVKAIIVPQGAAPSIAVLRRFCAERLAAYKVPRQWEFRNAPLPRSPLGKLLRQYLTP